MQGGGKAAAHCCLGQPSACVRIDVQIVHPDFLLRTMGHFYTPAASKAEGGAPLWELKTKLAFVQSPQDFFNLPDDDPMSHAGAPRQPNRMRGAGKEAKLSFGGEGPSSQSAQIRSLVV